VDRKLETLENGMQVFALKTSQEMEDRLTQHVRKSLDEVQALSSRMEALWKKLKVAVNTYGERLPVDAFLPDPESRIAERLRQRAARNRRPGSVEGIPIPEPSSGTGMEDAEEKPSSPPEQEGTSLEEDLRRCLTGNAFADPEDL